ncbi:MAG: NAD(P)/FAD-dependent oxidoreductase [Candidatus Heimdallarchaeota archaeon]
MNSLQGSNKLTSGKRVPTVLVLGAGVAGIRAALHLEKLSKEGEFEIEVIDKKNYHLLIPNLHEAATDRISADAVQVPLNEIFQDKNIEFYCATVSKIDIEEKIVIANGRKLPYDFLIIALGAKANFYGIPNLVEHAYPLRTLVDAKLIRNHVLKMFELAALIQDAKKKKEFLTFVVGGVGAAGTQFVTELADWIGELRIHYGIDQDDIQVVAVEAKESMGIDWPLARYAYKILREKEIKLILGAAITSIDNQMIYLSNGKKIPTQTLIWTGGISGNDLLEKSNLRVNHQGRAIVNGFLEAEGHEGVYVIGDASDVIDPETGQSVIPSAQMAINEANYVVEHLLAKTRKIAKQKYRPHRRGVAISLGRDDGASLVGNIRLLGKIGKFFKVLTELRYFYLLGGLRQVVEGLRLRSNKAMRVP